MKKISTWMAGCCALLVPAMAFGQETVETGSGSPDMLKLKAMLAIAAGLAIAIASAVGAISQGKVAATAMEGISRNPEAASKVMTPMIIALALIESLVIYALVIAFLLQGKI